MIPLMLLVVMGLVESGVVLRRDYLPVMQLTVMLLVMAYLLVAVGIYLIFNY